jgi:hypothetical protein
MSSEPLTESQKQQAKQILRSRIQNMKCPTCGGERWGLQERLHVMPAVDPAGAVDPSMGFPALLLTCKECYQVRAFNAAQMGLVDRS